MCKVSSAHQKKVVIIKRWLSKMWLDNMDQEMSLVGETVIGKWKIGLCNTSADYALLKMVF